MSETVTAPTEAEVNEAFKVLSRTLKSKFSEEEDSAIFARDLEYFKAVGALQKNYASALPANGKVPGKRGRKAGVPNGAGAASVVAGADAPLTETQSESAAPAPTRGRRAPNE